MILSKPKQTDSHWLHTCILACAMAIIPLGIVSAQDYEAVGRRLRQAVAAGELTGAQARVMLGTLKKSAATEKKTDKKVNLEGAWKRLEAMAKAGKLTEEQAHARMAAIKKGAAKKDAGSERAEAYLMKVRKELGAAVEAGEMSREDAGKRYKSAEEGLKKRMAGARGEQEGYRDRGREYLMNVRKELGEAVKVGKISKEDAIKRYDGAEEGLKKRMATARSQRGEEPVRRESRRAQHEGFERRIKVAIAQGERDQDQEHRRITREDYARAEAEIRGAVAEGKIAPEHARARLQAMRKMMGQQGERQHERSEEAHEDTDGDTEGDHDDAAIGKKIRLAVKAGKMTRKEASEKMAGLKKRKATGNRRERIGNDGQPSRGQRNRKDTRNDGRPMRGQGDRKPNLEAVAKRLEAAIRAGKMTGQEAKAKWVEINKKAVVGKEESSQGQAEKRIVAMQTLKYLALGCHLYADDHDGILPATLDDLKPYVKESYDPDAYELVASGNIRKIKQAGKRRLIRDKTLLPGKQRAVAFVDGHVEIIQVK